MKFIKQHDERDCGAACLSMIASHYGLNHTIQKFRELTKTDRNGANLYGLVDASQKIGFNSEALSGDIDELITGIENGEITLPFIAHIITETNTAHFIVVASYKKGIFTIVDPAIGKVKYTADIFNALWTGYIVAMTPSKEFRKANFKKGGYKKFFALLQGQYKNLVSILLLSFIISIIGIVGSFVFQIVIDSFTTVSVSETAQNESHEGHTDDCKDENCTDTHDGTEKEKGLFAHIEDFISENPHNFNIFFIAIIALYVLQALIQFLRGLLMSHLSKGIDIKLMMSYYYHIIDLPVSAIGTRNTGEYLSRFSDASTIRNAVSGATLTLMLDSLMVVACAVMLFQINSLLMLISVIIIALYAFVVLCYKKPLANINRKVMENNAKVQSFLKESIDGIETVKSHQAETKTKGSYNNKFTTFINSVFKNNVISFSQESIGDMVEMVGIVIVLWVGFGLVLNNTVTIGSLMTFYALLGYFITPIKNLIELQPMMQTAMIAADRLNDVLEIEIEKTEKSNKSITFERISLNNVDFRYGNNELTLRDVTLKINKGEKMAIVGESGSGKTTIAKLLLRFYEPENGEIFIDNKNSKDFTTSDIRNSIAYVDQNTFIFSDTIKNNLMLGNQDATDDEIKKVCMLAKLDELIERMPFGYDTYLDENGKNLSGGQRQRLAIARALLKNPKLLILDEATSNLDTITENAIKDTIFNINDDLTCVIIAHRLNTIQNCDRIIVMDDGEIVEEGTHSELLEKKGYYFKLFNQ